MVLPTVISRRVVTASNNSFPLCLRADLEGASYSLGSLPDDLRQYPRVLAAVKGCLQYLSRSPPQQDRVCFRQQDLIKSAVGNIIIIIIIITRFQSKD
jgi:hypothetical protein